jgi:hypothetical protein
MSNLHTGHSIDASYKSDRDKMSRGPSIGASYQVSAHLAGQSIWWQLWSVFTEPLLRGHLSWEVTFDIPHEWLPKTGLTVNHEYFCSITNLEYWK